MERVMVRRIALFVGPLGYIALGLAHPMVDPDVGDPAGLFIVLHLVQPLLIALVAYTLWTLVGGLRGPAAKVARVAVVVYVVAYTAFESVAGTAMGLLVDEANGLAASDRAVAAKLVDDLREHWVGLPLYLAAGLSWLAAAVAVAVAVRQVAPLRVSLAIGVGAAIFAVGHPRPFGPIGMTFVLLGVAMLELRRRDAVEDVSVPSTVPT